MSIRRPAPRHPGPLMEQLEPRSHFDAVPTVAWQGPLLRPTSTIVGDVNHDGLTDTAVAVDHEIRLFINNGDGTFRDPTITRIAGLVGRIAFARLDGDEMLDLVSVGKARPTTSTAYLRALLFDPATGTFHVISRRPVGGTSGGLAQVVDLTTADILPDGRDDIALVVQTFDSFRTASVFVLSVVDGQIANSGAGHGAAIAAPVRTLIGEVDSFAALALDPSGPAQLFIGVEHRLTHRTVAVALTPRSGTWRVSPITAFSLAGISSFAVTDTNLDGRADLVIATTPPSYPQGITPSSAAAFVLPRSVTGAFQPRQRIGSSMEFADEAALFYSSELRVLDVRDYDHDGFVDMLLLHSRSGTGYAGGTGIAVSLGQSRLAVVSTNPAVHNRELWSGYQRIDEPGGVSGANFPAFVGGGPLITGESLPGVIGIGWDTTFQLYMFPTIPV